MVRVNMTDILDGTFNFIGMLCFFGATAIGILAYYRKKSMSNLTFLFLFAGGGLFALGNAMEKWGIWTESFGDAFATGFMIFCATVGFFWIVVPIMEVGLENSNAKMRNIIEVASSASINVANMATELAASASEVNASSEEIATTTQIMGRDAQEVTASTAQLNNVMQVIKSIADQTNLLALNASIEAGRAGEYGRGFAVVADEVRKLAEESKKSVLDTNQKIQIIINKIEATTASMEGISASTEEQTASMEEISATANKLGTLADDLRKSLETND
jgi:hypothetical protein